VLSYYDVCLEALKEEISLDSLISLSVREDIAKMKYVPEEDIEKERDKISRKSKKEVDELIHSTGKRG